MSGGSSSPPPPPPPSPAEEALRRKQAQLIDFQIAQGTRQNEIFEELFPSLKQNLESQIEFQTDKLDIDRDLLSLYRETFEDQSEHAKQILNLQKRLAPSDQVLDLQEELTIAQGERALAAINSELPVDGALVAGFDDAREKLDVQFQELLGSGYKTSSTYLDAVNDLTAKQELSFDAARRGDLTTASNLFQTSLNQALIGSGAAGGASSFSGLPQISGGGGFNSLSAIQSLSGNASNIFSQASQSAGSLASQYQNDRNLAYQGTLQGHQGRTSTLNSLIGGGATIFGAYLGGGFF